MSNKTGKGEEIVECVAINVTVGTNSFPWYVPAELKDQFLDCLGMKPDKPVRTRRPKRTTGPINKAQMSARQKKRAPHNRSGDE
jgi:hypothetical protein